MRVIATFVVCGFLSSSLLAQVTGSTGGSQPHLNDQPYCTINYLIALQGSFPTSTVGANGGLFLGEVVMSAGDVAPKGMAFCNGQILSIAQNLALYNLLGTTYGGDGRTTFALPDLRGRLVMGAGNASGLTPRSLGGIDGAHTGVVTVNQMPAHTHTIPTGVTDPTGGGQPMSVLQPTLALNYFTNETGNAPPAGPQPILGQVRMTAATFTPAGQRADGSLIGTSQNNALYNVIGTTYGSTDPANFALPDLRGRVPVGAGAGPGLTSRTLGQTLGAEQVTLTQSQLPSHAHSLPGGGTTGFTGGGQSYDNIQPSLSLHYMIATDGIFPDPDGGLGDGSTPFLGEMTLFAGDTAPTGWSFCEGQLRSASETLFNVIGTTYGGDGVSTYALPDLRGRTAIDANTSGFVLGQAGGNETISLTVQQLPAHVHVLPEPANLATIAAGLILLRRRHRTNA